MREIHGEHVTFTGCRKRFDDLMAAFEKDAVKAMRASGTEEEVSERDMLLQDISDLTEAVADKKKAAKEDKVKKVDKRENDGHRIRAAALQGLKRKTAGGDDQESDHDDNAETPSKRFKRAAAATNDVATVASVVKDFSSMIESTNKLKEDEIAAKQEEIAAKKDVIAVRKEELALSHRKLKRSKRTSSMICCFVKRNLYRQSASLCAAKLNRVLGMEMAREVALLASWTRSKTRGSASSPLSIVQSLVQSKILK
ncbi:hypothetical protein SPRG_00310 [Saprolegnia parasitica CBS 223.65]|uniref:Uncharacterized protein n=1 Tax=Saprolegnia parasitica (strain CBS 223.65) TaxID=695850 RepID=A0A067CY69_SAPPC|nr:hypothetical protein SPRG_00310 [Saprolegnia parasitica CBS 223.65]KDO35463.1 hypothetical protein SPRG_00310 [Saprolegnia parasitica CBS 223.65]|eukprot:XP_012193800.1 hypothetical protein SPRG_00310 [Saprolegnia parasitica CBS 223.65]